MDVKEQIALSILKGAGGDVDKDYTSTAEIYRDVESIYKAQDNRQDVESLQVELIDNGTYTYDDRNTQGYKPVEINVNVPVDDYYNSGFENGIVIQKAKLESITITENGIYNKEDGYDEVEVNIDTQSYYDNGYNNGYSEGVDNGIQEQKAKLESITITENGIYNKEDGYNEVKVALDIPKPKIYNGFRFVPEGDNDYQYFKDIDFGLYDWSGVYDTTEFFSNIKSNDGGGLMASDFGNFIQNYNGDMLLCISMFEETSIKELPNFGEFTKNCMTMNSMFNNCKSLTDASNLQYWNTSNVTNMRNMFNGCSSLTTIPQLDTSKVTSMMNMFNACEKLTSIPQLDTSNVDNMYGMFSVCSSLTTIPLLDTSNVTNMSGMFSKCSSLTSIPLLDTSKVTDMSSMFNNCKSLTTIPQLDTSNVDNMINMLASCSKLTSVPLLDASNVRDIQSIFGAEYNKSLTDLGGFKDLGKRSSVSGTSSIGLTYILNLTHDSLMNVINNLYDRKSAGYSTLTLHMGSDNLAKLSDEEKAIAINKGWNLS